MMSPSLMLSCFSPRTFQKMKEFAVYAYGCKCSTPSLGAMFSVRCLYFCNKSFIFFVLQTLSMFDFSRKSRRSLLPCVLTISLKTGTAPFGANASNLRAAGHV